MTIWSVYIHSTNTPESKAESNHTSDDGWNGLENDRREYHSGVYIYKVTIENGEVFIWRCFSVEIDN